MQQGTVGGPVFIPCKLMLCCPHPECNCAPHIPVTKRLAVQVAVAGQEAV
jgi:hypothetical protein